MSFMGPDGPLKGFKPDSKVTAAAELLNDENVPTKTELIHPTALSVLELFALYSSGPEALRQAIGLAPEQAITVGHWYKALVGIYKTNMISKNRKSREEYTRSLQAIQGEESTTTAMRKIFGMG